jgi:putative membrane protein
MLWLKTFHIVFIVSFFGVLFYLPRIFVNLAQVKDAQSAEYRRLLGMAERLYRFGHILAIPALGFGIALWAIYGMGAGQAWFYAKMAVVILIAGYHHACGSILRKFVNGTNQRSEKYYRWFNEVPVLLLVIAVALVVVKPQI